MLNDLVIIHTRRTPETTVPKYSLGVEWSTCLRQINLLSGSELSLVRGSIRQEQEVRRGSEAYALLLEVVCGLHSPIIGETEVMGQFKEFCAKAALPATPWGYFLRQMSNDLLTDAKRIRHQYLHDQGSQSYGSLAARYLKHLPEIVIIGAGKLVREMLPWLVGQANLTVVNRSRPALEALREEFPTIRIATLDEDCLPITAGAGLLLAAPLSGQELADWAGRQSSTSGESQLFDQLFKRTLDLRGESTHDPISMPGEVLDLHSFFSLLEGERRRASDISAKARREISSCADQHLKQMQCRPFGWEDLCA